jgi:DNA-binding NarL/FixJ family response regulator
LSEVSSAVTLRADSSTVDTAAVEDLQARLSRLARTQDPARIAALSTELLETLRQLQLDMSAARDAAVLELHASGNSLNDIARHAGLTRGRVFQIVQRGRADDPSVLAT